MYVEYNLIALEQVVFVVTKKKVKETSYGVCQVICQVESSALAVDM